MENGTNRNYVEFIFGQLNEGNFVNNDEYVMYQQEESEIKVHKSTGLVIEWVQFHLPAYKISLNNDIISETESSTLELSEFWYFLPSIIILHVIIKRFMENY